jgi:polyisoprenoid-binding protein YceI
MKRLIISTLALTLGLTSLAQQKELASGDITFKSEKKDLAFSATEFSSNLDLTEKTLTLTLPVNNFDIKSKMQKNHFMGEDGMNTSEFANASFTGTIETEADLSSEGIHEVTVKGTLTVLGVGVEITTPATIEITADGVKTSATFKLNRASHKATSKYANMLDENIEVIVNANF